MKKELKPLTTKQIYLIFAGCLGICVVGIIVLGISVANLSAEVKTLEEEKSSMQTEFDLEKSELSEKVTLLSNQLTIRIEEEAAEAQKKVPSGLPVSGKVITIESEPIIVATESEDAVTEDEADAESEETDENIIEQEIPTVVFGVKKETQIVAAGAGTIEAVEQVDEGTCVKINHDNGYVSVYLFKGTPKVKAGDEVLRGTLLFEVTSNNAKFSFQILENGEYVNPMDLMEIHG